MKQLMPNPRHFICGGGRFKPLEIFHDTKYLAVKITHNFDFWNRLSRRPICFNRKKSWEMGQTRVVHRWAWTWLLSTRLLTLRGCIHKTSERILFFPFSFLLRPPAGIVLYRIYKVLLLLLLCVTMCVCVQYYPSCCCCPVVCDISALALTKNGRSFNTSQSYRLRLLRLTQLANCLVLFFPSSSFLIFLINPRKTKCDQSNGWWLSCRESRASSSQPTGRELHRQSYARSVVVVAVVVVLDS